MGDTQSFSSVRGSEDSEVTSSLNFLESSFGWCIIRELIVTDVRKKGYRTKFKNVLERHKGFRRLCWKKGFFMKKTTYTSVPGTDTSLRFGIKRRKVGDLGTPQRSDVNWRGLRCKTTGERPLVSLLEQFLGRSSSPSVPPSTRVRSVLTPVGRGRKRGTGSHFPNTDVRTEAVGAPSSVQ